MTGRTPSTTTVPRFPELLDIQCFPFTDCLWTALSTNPELARTVRTLDIGDSDTVPPELITKLDTCPHCFDQGLDAREDELRTSRLFVAALKHMSNLTAFRWDTDSPEFPGSPQPWSVLAAYCKILRHVDVYDGLGNIWGTELFDLSNLTYFRYVTSYGDPMAAPDMTRLGTMLTARCPQLQTLYLNLGSIHEELCPPADIGTSVLSGRWLHLESLTLRGTMCAPAAVVTFLKEHSGLQHLDIDRTVGCEPLWRRDIVFNPDFVVSDSDVDSPAYYLEALEKRLDCPSGILPNLKTLACFPGQAVDILKATFAGSRAVGGVELFLKDAGKGDRAEAFRRFAASHQHELTVIRPEDTWKF
ncbi:hypothetical protein FA95DRAFT_1678694 [Auriscalpium vulgare]|uniref:Uncharacterized protein n=1 Tax=Auriscalpium vulgare TaxID=40419 RepID=A0ACB8RVA0_9AGAM|nr:hypothetical protein FA95DRAFT_1678694 [Auriscalpium vulgare]